MGKNTTTSGTVVPDPDSPITGVEGTRADDAQPGERLPMPEPEGGWPADEFTGIGGSYVRDPFTGLRSRAVVDAEPQNPEGEK
jgi:hypothetical protein